MGALTPRCASQTMEIIREFKLHRLALLITVSLTGACSTTLDTRQEVSSSSPGIILFGSVGSVYLAKQESFRERLYGNLPNDFANNAASITNNQRRAARIRSLGVLFSAIGMDVESLIASYMCIYIVKTESLDIVRSIRRNSLRDFNIDSNNDIIDLSLPSTNANFPEQPNLPVESTTSPLDSYLSIAQTCDATMKAGVDVLISINENGATLHQLTPEMNALKLDIENRDSNEDLRASEDFSDG